MRPYVACFALHGLRFTTAVNLQSATNAFIAYNNGVPPDWVMALLPGEYATAQQLKSVGWFGDKDAFRDIITSPTLPEREEYTDGDIIEEPEFNSD